MPQLSFLGLSISQEDLVPILSVSIAGGIVLLGLMLRGLWGWLISPREYPFGPITHTPTTTYRPDNVSPGRRYTIHDGDMRQEFVVLGTPLQGAFRVGVYSPVPSRRPCRQERFSFSGWVTTIHPQVFLGPNDVAQHPTGSAGHDAYLKRVIH